MILKTIVYSSLLLASSSFYWFSTNTINAQTPPAQTYQPGFWQPVARVDLDRPITINLINETGIMIDYAMTNIENEPVRIEPEQTTVLDNVQPSLYMVVYPDSTDPDSSRIYLKYEVEVTEENIVEVRIKTTEDGIQSNRTFNLQDTGAIYLY